MEGRKSSEWKLINKLFSATRPRRYVRPRLRAAFSAARRKLRNEKCARCSPSSVVNGVRETSYWSGAQASSKRDVRLPICNSTTCVSRRYITKHKKPVLLWMRVWESRRHMSHCWFMCLLAREVEWSARETGRMEELAKRTLRGVCVSYVASSGMRSPREDCWAWKSIKSENQVRWKVESGRFQGEDGTMRINGRKSSPSWSFEASMDRAELSTFQSIKPWIPQMTHSDEDFTVQRPQNVSQLPHAPRKSVIKLSWRCKSTRKFYFSINKMETFFYNFPPCRRRISLRLFPTRDRRTKWEYFLAKRKLYNLRKIYSALSRRTYMEMSIINPAEKNEKLLPRSYAVNYLKAHSSELSRIESEVCQPEQIQTKPGRGASDEKRLRHTSNINYQFWMYSRSLLPRLRAWAHRRGRAGLPCHPKNFASHEKFNTEKIKWNIYIIMKCKTFALQLYLRAISKDASRLIPEATLASFGWHFSQLDFPSPQLYIRREGTFACMLKVLSRNGCDISRSLVAAL